MWLFTQQATHLLQLSGQNYTVNENSAAVQHLDLKLPRGEVSEMKY